VALADPVKEAQGAQNPGLRYFRAWRKRGERSLLVENQSRAIGGAPFLALVEIKERAARAFPEEHLLQPFRFPISLRG